MKFDPAAAIFPKNELRLHFDLGTAAKTIMAGVSWAGGQTQLERMSDAKVGCHQHRFLLTANMAKRHY